MRYLFSLILFSCLAKGILSAQPLVFRAAPLAASATEGPEELLAFLGNMYPASLAGSAQLVPSYQISSAAATYWTFRQEINGTPLYQAGIKVKMDSRGRVVLMDFLVKDQQLLSATPPRFRLDEAAVQTPLQSREATEISMERCFRIQDGRLAPAYRVVTFSADGNESFELLVDGNTGEELSREDRVAHFEGDTTGRARVFIPNPCTASGAPYGTLFSDNMDQHMPAFEPFIDTVTLQDLRFGNGTFYLEGPFIRIQDIAANTFAPATSSNGDFFFDRNASGFEDAMCYYHLDSYQRYVQSLGYLNLWGSLPLTVDPHGMGNSDNSSFVPNGNSSSLRFGEGGVDDAEDADVIIHEYGHALSYAAAPDTRTGTQRRGLDEGYGDYFAASYSYDLRADYGWSLMMNWDGHNEFWDGRSTDNPALFNSSITDIWELGEIWASTMMDIRQALGGQVTDRLQLEALYGNFSNMAFADAAWLVIDADSSLFGGVNTPTLKQHFCQRNILTGADCNSVGIDDDLSSVAHKWEVFPNPNTGQFTARWKEDLPPAPGQELVLVNSLGQVITRTQWKGNPEVSFNLTLAPGLYVLSLQEKGRILSRKKIAVF